MEKIYNNYFSGSVSQVSNCLEIVLYNKSSFSELVSIYNLESFYLKNLIGTSTKFVKLIRSGVDASFEYKKQLEDGFNVIIYISPISNSPVGYTEFSNTQGVDSSFGINLNIKRTADNSKVLRVEIKNQLVGKDLYKTYTGEALYNYATLKDIKGKNYRNKFTSNTGRLESDIYSFSLGSSWLVSKNEGWSLKINKNIGVSDGNYNICFYGGDLVLAEWSGISYRLYKLTGSGTTIMGNTRSEIKKVVGRYYMDMEGGLRDLITDDSVVQSRKSSLFCDYQSKHCTVYNFPTIYLKTDLIKYIPEINNIYLDLNNYLKSNQVVIYSKIGPWFILLQDFGGRTIYVASSPTTTIKMTEEDLNRAIFVGDQTVILCEDGYYSLYNSSRINLETERARKILYNGRLDYYGDILFCYLDTEEDEKHYEIYYSSELVHIVFKEEALYNTVLNRYRRNVYPECDGIPKLIGSFGGLIFYKNGNIVNYL